MKKLSMAAALALVVAGPALAGAKGAVVMEPVIADPYEAASSSGSLPAGSTALIAGAVAIAVVAGGNGGNGSTTTGN